eukprot:gene27635-34383_t
MVQTVRDLRAVKLIVEEKSRAAQLALEDSGSEEEDEEVSQYDDQ